MRIVSLLPSATEILFQLGVGDDVVGVTFECDTPVEARSKRIVSTSALPEGLTPGQIDAVVKARIAAGEDLYRLDEGAFADLDPTLVITQDLCAVCAIDVTEVDDALAHLGCRADVLTLDPSTLDDVIATVLSVGAATGTGVEAAAIVERCRDRLRRSPPRWRARRAGGRSCWSGPIRRSRPATGSPTWSTAAGGTSVLGRPGADSVGVEWSTITGCGAEVVIVAPCGFGLDGAAGLARQARDAGVLPAGAEVWAVDADAVVVRPGPRLVDGVATFAAILHPDRCGPPDPRLARRLD